MLCDELTDDALLTSLTSVLVLFLCVLSHTSFIYSEAIYMGTVLHFCVKFKVKQWLSLVYLNPCESLTANYHCQLL